jgi:radical SAM enzyme (TIGR01210 family)
VSPFDEEEHEHEEPVGEGSEGEAENMDGEGCAGSEIAPPQRRPKDPRKYVASWSERDSLDGAETRAWVLILRTKGCGWARCSMCGYHGESSSANADDIVHQFKSALAHRKGERIAKLYTSGSFLDEREISKEARTAILADIGKQFDRVVVESRPEFITPGAIKEAVGLCPSFEVAVGMESASPRVLSHSVRKGFTFEDFAERAKVATVSGARVRAYILLKPPFLNEREALDDAVASMSAAGPLCDTISLNPVNIQKGTVVEQLWKRRVYRTPWLWSALEAVVRGHEGLRKAGLATRIVCAPSGAGRSRGAHNCGSCDERLIHALDEYSVNGDVKLLGDELGRKCKCMEEWHDALEMGALHCVPYDAVKNRKY